MTNEQGVSSRLSKVLNKKSGGETQTPFYISVLASFVQRYRIRHRDSNTLRLVTLIKEYLCAGEDVEAEEALELVGLRKTSEELLFFGPLVVEFKGNQLDFEPFCYGSSMNSKLIRDVVVRSLPVRKVLTIENKATFVDLVNRGVDEETLVVYLAGFY